jgi:glycine betaine transporter
VFLYQFTPLKIEWIGMVFIALYAAVYATLLIRWLRSPSGAA